MLNKVNRYRQKKDLDIKSSICGGLVDTHYIYHAGSIWADEEPVYLFEEKITNFEKRFPKEKFDEYFELIDSSYGNKEPLNYNKEKPKKIEKIEINPTWYYSSEVPVINELIDAVNYLITNKP